METVRIIISFIKWIYDCCCIFRFQTTKVLPLNPANIKGMEPTLAFNTAISFMADTNLQHYSGENGLSYLSQLIGITF